MASPAGVPTNFDFFFIQSSSDIDKDSAVSLGILRENSQLGAEVDAALAAEGSPWRILKSHTSLRGLASPTPGN